MYPYDYVTVLLDSSSLFVMPEAEHDDLKSMIFAVAKRWSGTVVNYMTPVHSSKYDITIEVPAGDGKHAAAQIKRLWRTIPKNVTIKVAGDRRENNVDRMMIAQELVKIAKKIAYTHYSKDPRWIRAKYPGVDMNGNAFKRGEEVLYYPLTKHIISGKEAEAAWRQFEAEAQDEDAYSSQY